MVLSGRRSRRIGTRAWIVVGIVVTLVVLLVDVSIKSRSDGPVRTLSNEAWIDKVLPLVGQSISEGDEISQLRNQPVATSASNILPQLQGVVTHTAQTSKEAAALKPPPAMAGPSSMLLVCLKTRAEGTSALAAAMNAALTSTDPDPASQFTAAVSELQIADQAYALFLQNMPKVNVKLPSSVWVSDPGAFSGAAFTSYLATLRNARSSGPVHDLAVQAIQTQPPAVTTDGNGVQVLPEAGTITVTVTIGDEGNQAERGVIVTGSLHPPAAGYASSQGVEVPGTLEPGQSETVTLPPLKPPVGAPFTLAVSITINGQANSSDGTKSIMLLMPPPNAPATSSTTTGTSTAASFSGTGTSPLD